MREGLAFHASRLSLRGKQIGKREALLNDCVFDRLPAVSCKMFPKVHLRVKLFWIEVRVKLKETGKQRRSF